MQSILCFNHSCVHFVLCKMLHHPFHREVFPELGFCKIEPAGLDVFSCPVEGSKYRFSAALDVPRFPAERSTCRLLAGLDVVSFFPLKDQSTSGQLVLNFSFWKWRSVSSDLRGSSVSYVALGTMQITTRCLLANSEYPSIQAFSNTIFVEMFSFSFVSLFQEDRNSSLNVTCPALNSEVNLQID